MRIEIDHTLTLTPPPGTAHLMLHLLLTPLSGPTQFVESWTVECPGIGNAGRFTDAYGNPVHLVNQSAPEGEIVLSAKGVVVTQDTNGVLGRPANEPVPALFRRLTPLTRAGDFVAPEAASRLDMLHALMVRVGHELGALETLAQTQMQADGAQEQQQRPVVSADDYAHRFIAAARALDIPARFVVGYLVGTGLHAWAEAFDDALGWIGFDPRLQLCTTEKHVRLAIGLDAESATPLRTVPAVDIAQTAKVTATLEE
jgi:transglutaminase-like putative cysteine protease